MADVVESPWGDGLSSGPPGRLHANGAQVPAVLSLSLARSLSSALSLSLSLSLSSGSPSVLLDLPFVGERNNAPHLSHSQRSAPQISRGHSHWQLCLSLMRRTLPSAGLHRSFRTEPNQIGKEINQKCKAMCSVMQTRFAQAWLQFGLLDAASLHLQRERGVRGQGLTHLIQC